ncbi:sulfatase, partial [archaeon]
MFLPMYTHVWLPGKWHLGDSAGHSALERGFDETLTFPAGMSAYGKQTDPDIITLGLNGSMAHFDEFMRYSLPFTVSHNNQEHFEPNEYLTDYLSHRAVDLIHTQQHTQRPFFLSLTYTAPHSPLQCTRRDYEALGHIANPTQRVYAAMVLALERGIGEVLQALRDTNQHRNTLIIFTSDNGAAHYVGLPQSNCPYRGWKATLFEGGVRVPLFMQ